MWFQSKKPSKPAAPAVKKKTPKPGPDPARASAAMQNVNAYHRELTAEEIAKKEHRHFVGAMWEEVGKAQFEFLQSRGLTPGHQVCDIGCGALRAGVHLARYLDAGHYYGMDINASLIEAGRLELEQEGLTGKNANLMVNDAFEMSRFEQKFDYIIAASLFTHLFGNHIVRCLVEARKVLAPGGQFYATFFQAPDSAHLEPIKHEVTSAVTYYDKDPFHYSIDEMTALGDAAGVKTELIGKWCPRDQRMLLFTLR
jgi:SAM-dependent methyltransferase